MKENLEETIQEALAYLSSREFSEFLKHKAVQFVGGGQPIRS